MHPLDYKWNNLFISPPLMLLPTALQRGAGRPFFQPISYHKW